MDSWPSEEAMMKLATENNLSETAFIVKEEKGYHLRWFTPGTEVELCGHATLASSYVILNYYEPNSNEVKSNSLSGELTIRRNSNLYEMNFPTYGLHEIPVTDRRRRPCHLRPHGRQRQGRPAGFRLEGRRHSGALSGGLSRSNSQSKETHNKRRTGILLGIPVRLFSLW